MQKEILEKQPSAHVRVYVVWFSMVWSDSRSRWPAGAITDSRATHFWDEQRVTGRWFAAHPDYLNKRSPILWDAFVVYGPEAKWPAPGSGAQLSPAVRWGYPVIRKREELRDSLLSLLRK